MKEWIKSNKKIVAIVGVVVVVVGGSILGININNHYTERTTVYKGIPQENAYTVSYDLDGIRNTEKVEKIQAILANAKASTLTNDNLAELEGRTLHFMISHGTHTNEIPENIVDIWIQEDATGIYREGLTSTYYTLDKEAVEQLEKLLK